MSKHVDRRLVAILAADVVGYSRMIRADEDRTLADLKALHADIVVPKLAEHKGRIFKLMGDGALMEFASVVDAASYAIDFQTAVKRHERDTEEELCARFRIRIDLVDNISGNCVNLAARPEGHALPISAITREWPIRGASARAPARLYLVEGQP